MKVKRPSLEKDYAERLDIILSSLGKNPKEFIKKINFYIEHHSFCPEEFDISIKGNTIIFNVCAIDEEEPDAFWQTVKEELKEQT